MSINVSLRSTLFLITDFKKLTVKHYEDDMHDIRGIHKEEKHKTKYEMVTLTSEEGFYSLHYES